MIRESELLTDMPQLIRLVLHETPAAKVIEVIPDLEIPGQPLTDTAVSGAGWPRGAIPSSHLHYAVVESSPQLETGHRARPHHNEKLHGTPFKLLSDDQKSLSDAASPADLLVIPQSILGHGDSAKVLERSSGLVRPDGTVLLVDDKQSGGEQVFSRAGFRACFELHTGDLTLKMLRPPKREDLDDKKREFIIIEPAASSERVQRFSEVLQDTLGEQGHVVSPRRWTEIAAIKSFAGKAVILLPELEQPLLDHISEPDFESLRKLVLQCKHILWITCGNSPFIRIIDGFARSITSEIADSRFQVLNLSGEQGMECGPSLAARICSRETKDKEFREVDGALQTNRIFKSLDGNDRLASHLEDSTRIASLNDQKRPLRLTVGRPGLLETLHFIANDRVSSALADEDVEVEVKAAGLK